CLLAGIVNDTDALSNPAASQPAFQAAAKLMSGGADWRTLLGLFVKNRPINALRLMGRAMARLKFDSETGLASTVIFRDDYPEGADDCQMDGFANFLGSTLDVDVVLVLKDGGDGIVNGSFRTVGEADVSAVAQRLGGGGHRKAAGFSVPGKVVEREHGWAIAGK
ncbi:MAG: hypothetical protein KAT58_12920, partial [candidate division Zixibacteria bacterium]|nr:hypothetical protein [candidate division Zixibacteria bacterium]